MEYIIINESKLKIVCEKDDLAPYGINADTLEYGDAVSRKFLDGLLEEAKVKHGFETAKHRVLIQLFPDNEGGCEIFISKLGLLKKESESVSLEAENTAKKKTVNEKIKKVYFFEKLDFLLEACKRLSFLPTCKKSSAFYLEESGYYLYFEYNTDGELEEYGINTLNEYSFLLEYGEPQNEKEKLPYLNEYAKIICKDNAVKILSGI